MQLKPHARSREKCSSASPSGNGRPMNETLGKVHFWITFAGVYCIFMPMHWLGLLERARGGGPGVSAGGVARTLVTTAAMLTIAAQVIFLVNFLSSVWRKKPSTSRNPWRATTLEWFLPSPVPPNSFGNSQPSIYRSAYMYGERLGGLDFLPQHVSPEQLAKLR